MKKTVVIGASTNTERYSYLAAKKLLKFNHEIVLIGLNGGMIEGHEILKNKPLIEDVDTITLYINPVNQKVWYDYILSLKPKRIIYNPGTENEELMNLAQKAGIENVEACTLVMLGNGMY